MRICRHILIVLGLFLTFFLSSCTVGPDYEPPEFDIPKSYSGLSVDGVKEQDDVVVWWKLFKDDTLTELIEEAASSNKDILISLTRVEESRALLRGANSELKPGLQLRGGYEESRSSSTRFSSGGGSFEYELFSAGVDASWELDFFGRVRRNIEAQNAEFDGRVATAHDTQRIVLAEVANAYFALRGAQAELAITRKNIKLLKDTMQLVRAKYDIGVTSELDPVRALAQLEQTRATVSPLEAAVKTNIYRLGVLLGKSPLELIGKLRKQTPIPRYSGPLAIASPALLLQRRPDIRVAERTLASHTAQIGVATSALFPIVTIDGSVGVEAPKFSNLFEGAGVYSFGPKITWSPFDNGRLSSQIKAADARAEGALISYENTVLKALEEVESALTQFGAERERRSHLVKALKASKKAHNIARSQYNEGVLEFLAVITALENVLENESNLAKSDRALAQAVVNIYKAMGGGWEE